MAELLHRDIIIIWAMYQELYFRVIMRFQPLINSKEKNKVPSVPLSTRFLSAIMYELFFFFNTMTVQSVMYL